MKISTLKSTFTLSLIGLAAAMMTACGGGQPPSDQAAALVASLPVSQSLAVQTADEPEATFVSYDIPQALTMADVPSISPSVEGVNTLQVMRTKLNEATSVANVRRGPSVDFEVIGTVADDETIVVTGRAAASNWLQIEYDGQVGWLAGDLIAHQSLIHLLPTIDTSDLLPKPVEVETEAVTEIKVAEVSEAEQEADILKRLQTLSCAETPIRGFGEVWKKHPEVRPLLGCAFTNFRQDEHATRAAVQTFQGGWMLWLETDTVANVDPIYVFFNTGASYIRFGDRELVDAHSYGPTPRGFNKIGDRFAKVYWEDLTPQQRGHLGLATNEARDSSGAFQEFEHGRMFWAGEADTIYIIYSGIYDFDGDGKTTWFYGWKSYEDTFEAGDAQYR